MEDINYKGEKHSVQTKYIDLKLKIIETNDININNYYNEDFIACHALGDNKYNYKSRHMYEILKFDYCKHLLDGKVNDFIKENMDLMDILLGE